MDRVRDLVAAGGVSVVLAQDRDRFAREPAYHYLLRREFEEHGTKIRALNDRGDDSPEGELTDGILDQLAKFERAKMMERTRRGKQRKAREGRIIATRAAFGFDFNAPRDGYVVNPDQMEIVQHVFYMAGVEKATIYAIRMDLKRMGLKTPSGKADWDHTFVRGLLLNDLYKPHTFEEIRRIVSPEVAERLDPEARYGVWWSGRRAFQRKLVSKNTTDGQSYKYRYKVTERATRRPDWRASPRFRHTPRVGRRSERGVGEQPKAGPCRIPGLGALGRDLTLRGVRPVYDRPYLPQARKRSHLPLLRLRRRRSRGATLARPEPTTRLNKSRHEYGTWSREY
jgi:site-specific DNA recombinase